MVCMKRIFMLLLLSVLLALGVSAAYGDSPSNILYYVDEIKGTDMMAEALDALSDDVSFDINVTTAVSSSDFKAELDSQDWDLVIVACQEHPTSTYLGSFEDSGLEDYVNNGGRVISCYWSAADIDYLTFFGATSSGDYNETSMDVTYSDLSENLVSNPVPILTSVWGEWYSTGLSPATEGDIEAASFENGESAIIISNNGRTIINGFYVDVISDDTLFINEIKYVLSNEKSNESSSGSSGGCNVGSFPATGVFLLAPLLLLARRKG